MGTFSTEAFVALVIVNLLGLLIGATVLYADVRSHSSLPKSHSEVVYLFMVFVQTVYSLAELILSIQIYQHGLDTSYGHELCQISGFLCIFAAMVIACHVALAVDRWRATIYAKQVSEGTLWLIIGAISLLFFSLGAFQLTTKTQFVPVEGHTMCFFPLAGPLYTMEEKVRGLALVVVTGVLTLFMTFAYTRIYISVSHQETPSVANLHKKLANRCLIILVAFLLCWLPITVGFFYRLISGLELPAYIDDIGIILTLVDNSISPILTVILIRRSRSAYLEYVLWWLPIDHKSHKLQAMDSFDLSTSVNSMSTL